MSEKMGDQFDVHGVADRFRDHHRQILDLLRLLLLIMEHMNFRVFSELPSPALWKATAKFSICLLADS